MPWFSVDVLNHYHLRKYVVDSANVVQEDLTLRPQLEAQYDLTRILEVRPTMATTLALQNHGLYFRRNAKGFFVGIDIVEQSGTITPRRSIDDTLVLQFEVLAKDTLWINYSDLPLNGIGETLHTVDGRQQPYRNIYFFSNTKGTYPGLTKVSPLAEATLDVNEDVVSTYTINAHPDALGIIEIHAFVAPASPANLIENGTLNVQANGANWSHPEFTLEVANRSLVWKYVNQQGAEVDRTPALPFSQLQINPVPLLVANNQSDRPNPRPDNIKYETSNQQYVAEVYL